MAPADRRVLLIAPTLPAEGGNGLAIRLGVFAQALARIGKVDLLCIPVFGPPADDGLAKRLGLSVHLIDPKGRQDTQFRLLLHLADPAARLAAFRAYGRSSLNAHLSAPILAEVRQLVGAQDYDLVHVARAYLMDAGIVAGDAPLTADLDEDDAWSWRSLANIAPTPDGADWSVAEAEAADRALRRMAPRFSALFISGPVDGRRIARRVPGLKPIVVPNPAPGRRAEPRADDGRTILFVGSFGYAPNVDGLDWFVTAIWPRIREALPDARLRVAGRDLPSRFAALAGMPGVEALGSVDHLGPLYSSAMLAIAPLRAGGGTRIKLIEAAALGVPIVSTRLAARGLSFGTPRGMWIADAASDFAEAVIDASRRPEDRARRVAHAQSLALKRHDRERIIAELACRFQALLAK